MQDIADDSAGRAGDNADHGRQEWQRLLSLRREQPLRRQFLLPLLEQLHQRANTRRPHPLCDHLIVGAAGISRQPPLGHHLKTFLGLERQLPGAALPHDGVERRALILDVEIQMPRLGQNHTPQFTPHPNERVILLHRALQRASQFRDRHLRRIGAGLRLRFGEVIHGEDHIHRSIRVSRLDFDGRSPCQHDAGLSRNGQTMAAFTP